MLFLNNIFMALRNGEKNHHLGSDMRLFRVDPRKHLLEVRSLGQSVMWRWQGYIDVNT